MIYKIITKVLEELNKENPKLDYVRGMLEVLLASESKLFIVPDEKGMPGTNANYSTLNAVKSIDEGTALDRAAAAKLKEVQNMSQIDEVTVRR